MMRPVDGVGVEGEDAGVLLGLFAGGAAPGTALAAAERLGGRCRAAASALASLPDAERQQALDGLAARVGAAVPEGLERAHPGWVRRSLEGESSVAVRAIAAGLPGPLRHIADEILRLRGDSNDGGASATGGAAGLELRRSCFAGLAPMADVAGPTIDDVDRRGAELLGLALVGAPAEAVARAAAGVGEPLARVVLASALRGDALEREEARALVASVPTVAARGGLGRAVGLRALARELATRGPAARAAVAQRLPPPDGDTLLALAAAAGEG
jgi:hypothetical protein